MKYFKLSGRATAVVLALFITVSSQSQIQNKLILKSGPVYTPENIREITRTGLPADWPEFDGKAYGILQFQEIPSAPDRKILEQAGFHFLDYLPERAYIISFDPAADLSLLGQFHARALLSMQAGWKIHPMLDQAPLPAWAVPQPGEVDVVVSLYRDVSFDKALQALQAVAKEFLHQSSFGKTVTLRISDADIGTLAAMPFVSFIEPVDPPSEPENYTGRTLHRVNVLNTSFAGGRKYDGTGVKVMLQDDGIIGPHIDYKGRIGQQYITFNSGNHGDHIAGTIMGAGNLDPKTMGMAPGATIYTYQAAPVYQGFDSIPSHYFNPGIVISSTSYSNGCNAGYTSFSRELDQQIRLYPSLMHVFSAGNAGNSNCGYGAGPGWGNITGGHKMGKNMITTGNLSDIDFLLSSSSRGPASDGRIKPDICAKGSNVYSTVDPNSYDYKTGTSMACPGISGSLAALYSAYKALNAGNNPPSALMKAVILNTADDLGNPGPDFKYGWGRINDLRAVKILESHHYLMDSIDQGQTKNHNFSVPAGTKQMRVMVYWADYEALANAAKALVNDLDIYIVTPQNDTILPWVLDPTPNPVNLNLPAMRGRDSLNNVEQVTIDTPSVGNYTLYVNGFQVPQGPQTYFVVYEYVGDTITVTYPVGGESFAPGEIEKLRWDAFGTAGSFTIEYSTDNGSSWTQITNSVNGSLRYYDWTVPNTLTGQALIRVSRGTESDVSDAPFSIMGVPANLTVTAVCVDTTNLQWDTVPGATGYIVYRLGSMYMDSMAYSSTAQAVLPGVNSTQNDWFAVAALGPNGAISRRSLAVEKLPGTFNCPTPNDLALYILSPDDFVVPDCAPLNALQVTVVLENSASNILNGSKQLTGYFDGTFFFNTIVSDTLNVGDTIHLTLPLLVINNSPGIHEIVIEAAYQGDNELFNNRDTLRFEIYAGQTYTLPYYQDFESFIPCPTTTNCELGICTLAGGWFNPQNGTWDNIDWRTDFGGTPSINTGPSFDHNPGTTLGNYLYTEASACFNEMAMLMTPCFDLSNTTNPKMVFWYYMYGQSMGTLTVDIFDGSWDTGVVQISGNHGNAWLPDTIDLDAYAGKTVVVRFRGTTGPSYTSDITLDDISVIDMVAPVAGFEPAGDTVCLDSSVTFKSTSSGLINTYSWNFGANANPPSATGMGPYTVFYSTPGWKTITLQVSSGLGNSTAVDSIFILEKATADFSYSVNNLTVTFTDQSSAASAWLWDFGDGNQVSLQNPQYTYATGNTYTVTLVAMNQCGSDTLSQQISVFPDGITGPGGTSWQVFPNPTTGWLTVKASEIQSASVNWKITDITGRVVLNGQETPAPGSFRMQLDLSTLPKGLYHLELATGSGLVRLKLVLQ